MWTIRLKSRDELVHDLADRIRMRLLSMMTENSAESGLFAKYSDEAAQDLKSQYGIDLSTFLAAGPEYFSSLGDTHARITVEATRTLDSLILTLKKTTE